MKKKTSSKTSSKQKTPARARITAGEQGTPDKKTSRTTPLADLREKSEKKPSKKTAGRKNFPICGVRGLDHELGRHQADRETQSEALRRTQHELEEARGRYAEFYDFAPIGFFTFDALGAVRELNIAGANLLGVERGRLTGMSLSPFMEKEGWSRFRIHCADVLKKDGRQTCELKLKKMDGATVHARFESVAIRSRTGTARFIQSVVHDITERMNVEAKVEHLASFPRMNPNPIIETDLTGKVLFCNAACLAVLRDLGVPEDAGLFLPEDMDAILKQSGRRSVSPHSARVVTIRDRMFAEDITLLPGLGVARIYAVDSTERIQAEESLRNAKVELEQRVRDRTQDLQKAVASLREQIEERARTENQLRETRFRLFDTLDTISEGFFLLDHDWRYTYVNAEAAKLWRRTREELLGRTLWEIAPSAKDSVFGREYHRAVREKVSVKFEALSPLLGIWVEVRAYPSEEGLAVYFHDITARKQTEDRIARLNLLYSVLSRVNEAIVRTPDAQTLYERVCRITVENGLFKMAWIGLLDQETRRVNVAASHGDDGGYLKEVTIIADDVPEGKGPTGRAVIERTHCICPDIEHDSIMRPWRDRALRHGFRSSAAFPLYSEARVVGALTVYAGTPQFFTGEEIGLLTALADDISFALASLASEARRMEGEAILRKSEAEIRDLYNNAPCGYHSLDKDGVITRINDTELRWLGYSREEVVGKKKISDFYTPEGVRIFQQTYPQFQRNGRTVDMEFEIVRRDGTLMPVLLNGVAIRDQDGNFVATRSTMFDITERRKAGRRSAVIHELLAFYAQKLSRKEYLDAAVGLVRSWSGFHHVGIRIAGTDRTIPFESCEGYSEPFLEREATLSLLKDRCICTRIVGDMPELSDRGSMTPNGSFYSADTTRFVEGLSAEDSRKYRGVCMQFGYRSLAVIPIRYRRTVLGVIHLADERESLPTPEAVEFLEQLSTIIGEAVFRFSIEDDLRRNYDELRHTSELLERILSTTHMLIVYMDRDFNFIRVNRAYAEAESHYPEYFTGRNYFELCPDGELEPIFRTVVRTGERFFAFERAFRYPGRREGGETYWDWSLMPVREADGAISGLVLTLVDVTDRRRAEEQLGLYVNLINQSSDAIYVADSGTGAILELNEAACVSTGYSRKELLAMNVMDLAERQGSLELWAAHVAEARKKGSLIAEDILRRRDKSSFPVEVSTKYIAHEKQDYLVAVIRDITERKRAEEERARLVSAVEAAAEAVVITDPSTGVIQYVNPAFEQLTGYAKEEALGRTRHFLESEGHDGQYYAGLRETLARDGVWRGKLVSRKKDGTAYFEECTVSAVRNAKDEIVNYVYLKRDVTERLRLESIAESVNTMKNIGYVFSGVRHEIGNPINSVKMILTLLQHKLDVSPKEVLREYLDRSLSELGRVEHLLKSLKNYNLYETPELENLNMVRFLEKFLDLAREDFEKKGITISWTGEPGAEWAVADTRALQQVFLNLLTNAADALTSQTKPAITIHLTRKFGQILIQVTDNGTGMTEKQQADLFKPFYTSKPQGTGLGLVLVKKMLAKMNGDIEIASLPDQGTTVSITLPEGTHAT